MATAEMSLDASTRLRQVVQRLDTLPGFSDVLAALARGEGGTIDGAWGSGYALVAAAIAQHAPGPVVVVSPFLDDLDTLTSEISLFAGRRAERFPAWETSGEFAAAGPTDEIFADRLRCIKQLAGSATPGGNSPLVVASIESLLQPVPSLETVQASTRTLRVGDEIDLDQLLAWMVEHGLKNMTAVELPGEFALHGGILDLFAPDWYEPVRVELFGDQIESIRRFDLATQRSHGALESVELTILPAGVRGDRPFTTHLPRDTWFVLFDPGELEECGRRWLRRLAERAGLYTVESTLKRVLEFPQVSVSQLPVGAFPAVCHLTIESVERFRGETVHLPSLLDRSSAGGDEIFLVCENQLESDRLSDLLSDSTLAKKGAMHYPLGTLRTGLRLVHQKVTILCDSELVGRRETARTNPRKLGRAIDSFLELREGDYVVHLGHGIGHYLGLKLLESEGQSEEHLEIEFAGGTKIFVPASKIDLVQKYVGGTKSVPRLSKIGGKSWLRQKEQAQESVIDLATQMLDLQATRASQPGIVFNPDSLWQKQFEATFPYTETPDQLTSIAAIKKDMESTKPMDRLVCGEVGYGKTELALRAAFKAVDNGYQVAILVPTTILAEQHYRSFTKRLADFPFKVGCLSRFRSKGEQQKIVDGLAGGSVDIVIGTHRLVQPDIHLAHLGLLVIDEEQRFGVEAKEWLKVVRQQVDVLTLTATPIPRTLHLSLLGVRDISNLETPPEDRLAVETRVVRFDAELVSHAIERELGRGGQVFFIHNRVKDIQVVAQKLQQLAPTARIAVGHGQMSEHELDRVMLDFVDHKYDILVATTIVESGLDIPNANTMFINDAENYGLAELHQLRGRVGRYKHRAYCYLLVNHGKILSTTAAKRLKAIEEFSSIGAGFGIAMRDLEIRGAGNILGTQQSGHIAAVGYELYCTLLEQAVRRMQNLPPKERIEVHVDIPGEAYLPKRYVPDMRLKIDLYRRLSRATTDKELDDLRSEMTDRFGKPVEVVARMLELARLRLWAHHWKLKSIHLDGPADAIFEYKDRNAIAELVLKSRGRVRVVDHRQAFFKLRKWENDPDILIEDLKSLLLPR